jgi:drug/metabolite transporter (DMT)-like permease
LRSDDARRGIVLIVISSALFALMNAIVKLLASGVGPIEIGFFRQFFSLLPIGIMIAHHGGPPILRTARPFGHLFRGLIGNLGMIVIFVSIAMLPLADATALSFSSPLFVTALSVPLLAERVGLPRWAAVVVGFTGVVIMTDPSGAWFTAGAGAGAGVAVLGAMMSALMMITIRQLGLTEPAVRIVFYFAAIGCLVLGALLPFFWTPPTAWEWIGLVAVGLIGGLSQLTMTEAYRHAPAALLAPFVYSSLVWSTLLGYLLWSQLPARRIVVGGAVVIASGLFIVYRERRPSGRQKPEELSPAE